MSGLLSTYVGAEAQFYRDRTVHSLTAPMRPSLAIGRAVN